MRKVRIYSEGQDDQAYLDGLEKFKILPADVEISKRPKGKGGESTLLRDTLDFASPSGGVGGLAIVLRDFDDLTPESIDQWFATKARTAAVELDPTVQVSTTLTLGRRCVIALQHGERIHRIIGIGVGRRDDARLLGEHGVSCYAIDDYLFPLALRADVYNALHGEFSDVPHELALKKLKEVPELLRRNGLVVNQSKRLMHLFRATTGFRAAPATFIQRLFEVALELGLSQGDVRAMAVPLVDDLEWAADHLRTNAGTSSPPPHRQPARAA